MKIMIRLRIVTLEQAKILKEKGFPQPNECPSYKEDGEFTDLGEGSYYAPSLSLVQKWLIEEKNFIVNVVPAMDWDDKAMRYYNFHYECWYGQVGTPSICTLRSNEKDFGGNYKDAKFETYEEALSEGINKALTLI